MSASSLVQAPELQYSSTSSATEAGTMEILMRELYWQSLMNASAATPDSSNENEYYLLSMPTDPELARQWHLINSGQNVGNPDGQPIFGVPGEDINVAGAWQLGYTGEGVVVAVIDTGVQLDHPDLADNIDLDLSFDPVSQDGDGNPIFPLFINAHGTAVAGIIGAVANGIGGVGVAPGVTLVPIRAIDASAAQINQVIIDSFRHTITNGIDITNNSWGSNVPRDIAALLASPTIEQFAALRDSIAFGRDLDGPGGLPGLGVIHVFAAGNSAGPNFDNSGNDPFTDFFDIGGYDFAGYDGWVNSRYTIGVTGVDHDGFYNNEDGTVTAYPETSAAVLVAAPTGSQASLNIANDFGFGSGLFTTDLTGDFGLNAAPNQVTGQETEDPAFPFDRDFYADTDYTSRMNGTSAAAPVVSGVVALMLEANPNLSWRDVQEILVRSARQNAQFEIPENGEGQGNRLFDFTQNTWIMNQMPVFHDPDPFNPFVPVDPAIRTLAPTLDPNAGFFLLSPGGVVRDHFQPTPQVYTNGAGYTVSQGIGYYGEQIGYAHGVVDAELAVLLAEQWHTKNQALPGERTFTTFVNPPEGPDINIPGAEQGNLASGRQIVPGGIGGAIGGGFISYWNEYFDAVPFDDPNQVFPFRGAPISFSVPDNNTMSIETVEVKLSISGGTAELMDHMRVLLVSPDGTHHELNHFWVEPPPNLNFTMQNASPATVIGVPGSLDNGGQFVWTFSSKRSWGERSDDAIVFDSVTGLPVVDDFGLTSPTLTAGQALTQGWQLVIENWNFGTAFGLAGAEIAWHGSPIGANTERIQGFVGIDEDQNDDFNYSRVIQSVVDFDGDPTTIRFGEVINTLDETQEEFAANVTVVARRASDNVVVAQFVTGADGNYYFDLVPDDYIISIEDTPLGVAKDDNATPLGLERHYRTEWVLSADHFRVSQRDANLEIPLDINGQPIPWLDDTGNTQVSGVKNVNFLLDPGAPPAQQVEYTGTVYADTNGDGVFNGDDVALGNVNIFGDVNRNGQRDAGEVVVQTNAQGQYTLVVPLTTSGVMNVGIVRPTGWVSTNDEQNPVGDAESDSPLDGLEAFFVRPGDTFGGVNFYIDPPANGVGGGGVNQPGILMGVVFNDVNNNGQRNTGDQGIPGFTVYIDANNNGVVDGGDTTTVTNQFGAYAFTNVAPGQRVIRVESFSPYVQTTPLPNVNGGARIIQLTGSSTWSNLVFGFRNTAVMDFGDLPASFDATLLADNGARHRGLGNFRLGTLFDTESNGIESANAQGDDVLGMDEDGVAFGGDFIPGASTPITVTANRTGGFLQAWADWNQNGQFDADERVFTNVALQAGANNLAINVPANAASGAATYLRFRYGEFGINSFRGEAAVGEVEDYVRTTQVLPAAQPTVVGLPGDFDQDGDADGSDFLTWQRNLGRTNNPQQSQGNADADNDVDRQDMFEWRQDFGATTTVASVVAETSDFNGDGAVTGGDLLAWQRGLGTVNGATLTQGDGNADGRVDRADLTAWTQAYGAVASTFDLLYAGAANSNVAASTLGSGVLRSFGSSVSLNVADAAQADADARAELFAGGSLGNLANRFENVAGRVRAVGDALENRFGEVREVVRTATGKALDRLEGVDLDFLRRDRAFDDLFGSRKRQGLRTEFELELPDEVDGSDEAFAAIADHFEWRLS